MSHDQLMDELYRDLWAAHGDDLYGVLDRSLGPRPSAMMIDLAERAGLGPDDLVLDLGCGKGGYAFDLARRFGCCVSALDSAMVNLKDARKQIAAREAEGSVSFQQGLIEQLPYSDEGADMIWCRDILVHAVDLEGGLAEFARVLKPGGAAVLFVTLATDLLMEGEAERLFKPIHIVGRNLHPPILENALAAAGFKIEYREQVAGERLEYAEEQDGGYSREMLRLSRMIRAPERLSFILGRKRFEMAQALYYWSIYLLIGKLTDAYYIVRR